MGVCVCVCVCVMGVCVCVCDGRACVCVWGGGGVRAFSPTCVWDLSPPSTSSETPDKTALIPASSIAELPVVTL